ncbi:MAG: GTPase [Nanoarchaeota archaeon]
MRLSGPPTTHNRHHKAVPAIVAEAIRISDIVVEILDARDLELSRNPEIEKLIDDLGKKLIHVVNKVDLIDSRSGNHNFSNLRNPVFVSVKKNEGIRELREKLIIESKRLKQKRKTHITLIGYPNVGKSSLINLLVRRNATEVSSESGWTKSINKIRFTREILLLDVPGLIRKEENLGLGQNNLKNQAKIGVQTPERTRNPEFLVSQIMKEHPKSLEKYYSVDANGDPEILLEELGRKWNFLAKGGIVHMDRTARKILKDWMDGKIEKD